MCGEGACDGQGCVVRVHVMVSSMCGEGACDGQQYVW